MNKKIRMRQGFLVASIFLTALLRLLPHPWNFTPVGAVCLFGGATFDRKRDAFLVPLLALLVSDALIGFYPTLPWVYLAHVSVIGWGFLLRRRPAITRVLGASVAGSLSFFLISNFGHWLMDPSYAKNGVGLLQCYIAALPFFRGTLGGTLFYGLPLFGIFKLLDNKIFRASPILKLQS